MGEKGNEKNNDPKTVLKENSDDFALYTEKIIKKPSVKYRKLLSIGKIALSAILFGAIACITIVLLYPMLSKYIFKNHDDQETIIIDKDEYTVDASEQNQEDGDVDKNIDVEDYNTILSKLTEKSATVQKSIVSIDCNSSILGTHPYEDASSTETVGLIIGDTSSYYYILTSYRAITDPESILVKFSETAQTKAVLMARDEAFGMALLRVAKNNIPSSDRQDLAAAYIDNSYKVKQGDMYIVAGKIYGQNKSVDYGTITSITYSSETDNIYEIFHTSLPCREDDYGYLFNSEGNVIGIISQGGTETINAVGCSDLKSIILSLSNGNSLVYMGIRGRNVTNEIAAQYSMPVGVYVSSVIMDSPAFQAGLQGGDIIIGIDGNMVLTFQAFSEKLYQCSVGQDITVSVMRAGKEYKKIDFTVTLTSR
jgi:S1-C subfamily serine protease